MEQGLAEDRAAVRAANVGMGHGRTDDLVVESPRALPARVRWCRGIYLVLAWGFVACVLVQVFFAGLAIFVDSARWLWHTNFIHVFEFLPIIMLPLAFAARLPVALRWLTGLLFILIGLQYATAQSGGTFAALHPVNALLISWVAIYLGQRAWRATFGGRNARGRS